LYDRETGRPKGFGFCELFDEAGARNAVSTLNGTDFNGGSLRMCLLADLEDNCSNTVCVLIKVSFIYLFT
uniref:RRM domain-containing protein n=1 Tax=Heligmosomoides polygyrus TaxID=6339 RepID=A0A183F3R7_HELPZ